MYKVFGTNGLKAVDIQSALILGTKEGSNVITSERVEQSKTKPLELVQDNNQIPPIVMKEKVGEAILGFTENEGEVNAFISLLRHQTTNGFILDKDAKLALKSLTGCNGFSAGQVFRYLVKRGYLQKSENGYIILKGWEDILTNPQSGISGQSIDPVTSVILEDVDPLATEISHLKELSGQYTEALGETNSCQKRIDEILALSKELAAELAIKEAQREKFREVIADGSPASLAYQRLLKLKSLL